MSRAAKRVVLIILAGGLVAAFLGEWAARRRVERRYQVALEVRKQLELELGELRADRDRLSDALRVEQQQVEQLSKTLSAKNQELQEVIGRLTQEERVIQGLQEKLLAMQRQLDLLQGELSVTLQTRTASLPLAAEGMVHLEKVVVASPVSSEPGFQGRVISVHPEWHFVVIDLGWDVVNIGDLVSIYRNEQLLGKARIERVQEQVCAATLLPEWTDAKIQINDVVYAL